MHVLLNSSLDCQTDWVQYNTSYIEQPAENKTF